MASFNRPRGRGSPEMFVEKKFGRRIRIKQEGDCRYAGFRGNRADGWGLD